MKKVSLLPIVVVAWLLSACEPAVQYEIPRQKWNDVVVRIESRPAPPTPGMNEFWIILNDTTGRPVTNVVVSVRASSSSWNQAIQDGHTGVFRRAIRVDDPSSTPLLVQLRKGKQEAELSFSLAANTN